MFYDGNLCVDNFSNKCFTNAEVTFPDFRVLTSFIEEKVLLFKILLIVGDINISMLLSNDASRNWISFLGEFGLQQQVTVPTHKSGGIIDQVITSEEVEV